MESRVKKLAEILRNHGIDAAVLFNPDNIRFFTDFRMNRATESILSIDRDGGIFYIIPPLDRKRADRDCWIDDILTFPEDTSNYLSPLGNLFTGKTIKKLGIEAGLISYHKLSFLKETYSADVCPIDGDLFAMRSVKTENELIRLKEAARIIDAAMSASAAYMKEGMAEAEITGYARYIMEKEGGEGASFDPFLMSGENAWLPQRFASRKKISEGELFVFDMGAIFEGYCSDLTRTLSLGGLNSKQKEIFDVSFEAQQRAIEAVRPGVRACEIDKTARDFITRHGYGGCFPHITGHGLGISIHEMPILDADTEILLEANMVLTVEPGIYLEGVGAARTEDMVLVTERGHEILTRSKYDFI